jgi:hypothetical protein
LNRREKTQSDTRTPTAGENLDWDDAVFVFDLDGDGAQQLVVEFEVKAQVPILGNRLVGTASVPVDDLAAAGGGRAGDDAGPLLPGERPRWQAERHAQP